MALAGLVVIFMQQPYVKKTGFVNFKKVALFLR